MTLEITDREEFKDKLAFLMAANVSMISAGAPPRAELAGDMIDEFLNQFVIATPAKSTTPFGYVIRDRWDGRELDLFKDTFFDSEEAALASIDQAYARPDWNEFHITPLYL